MFYDDVQYDKHGWRNRNRIKTANGTIWLTIPVAARGNVVENTPINQIRCASKQWGAQALGDAAPVVRQARRNSSATRRCSRSSTARQEDRLAELTIDLTRRLAR